MQIYEALKMDHDGLKQLLAELVSQKEGEPFRRDLVAQIRDELVPHSRAEEAVFYNSIRAIGSARDLVVHSYQEHLEAEGLLRALQIADTVNVGTQKTAAKLQEAVLHHIATEESDVFRAAKSLFTSQEAEMMAGAFERLKAEVKSEGMISTTLELVANMMPARLSGVLGKFNLERRI